MPMSDTKTKRKDGLSHIIAYMSCIWIYQNKLFSLMIRKMVFFLIKMIIEGDEGHMTAWLQRKR